MEDLFDIENLPRCERHGCVMIQVQEPVCLIEWLAEKAGNRTVQDVILREEEQPALILNNGFMLPISGAYDAKRHEKPELALFMGQVGEVEVDLRFDGWRVSDLWFVRAKNSGQEAMLAEIRPPETREMMQDVVDEYPSVMLHLSLGTLLYLLFDEEIRKVEP
jgi:hypothetical protein